MLILMLGHRLRRWSRIKAASVTERYINILVREPDNFSVPSQGTNCQCIFLKGMPL